MPSNFGAQQGPSCFDRVKLGFMMGMCIGMASGAIFGGFGGFRYGLRGKELVQQVIVPWGGSLKKTIIGNFSLYNCTNIINWLKRYM